MRFPVKDRAVLSPSGEDVALVGAVEMDVAAKPKGKSRRLTPRPRQGAADAYGPRRVACACPSPLAGTRTNHNHTNFNAARI